MTHLLGHVTDLGHLSHLLPNLPFLAQLVQLPILSYLADLQAADLCLYGVSRQLQQGGGGCDESAGIGCQRLSDEHLRVTLRLMGHHTVLLLKLLATNGAGELISGISIMLLHVPVERRLLTTCKTTDFTPGEEKWTENELC